MKVKTILLTGALALVIIGCVIAAGCTSSETTTTTSPSVSDEILIGAWTFTNDDGVHTIVMKNDGTGFVTTIAKEDGTRIVKHSKFTWTKNADGTITHTLEKETDPVTLTYDAEKETFLDNLQHTLTKMDPITGIWFSEGTDLINNKTAKFTDIFKNDGTGVMGIEFDDGTTQVVESTWKKNADGSYSVTYADGFTDTFVLDENKGTMNSKADTRVAAMQKNFDDSYYYLSILGPWYDKAANAIVFINADGTITSHLNEEKIADGTWKIADFGKFDVHGISGVTPEGEKIHDMVFIYNRVNDTISADDEILFIRPNVNLEGLTYEKFN